MFEPLKESEKSLAEQVAAQILRMIVDHNLAFGEKLPNEFEIAKSINVGRGTVREAVKILVSRNVLEIIRGKGTFVTSNPGELGDPFGLVFYKDQYKLASDLIEIRLILEPEIAALSAVRASEKEIEYFRELNSDIMKRAENGEDYTNLDTELHVSIAKSTGNLVMSKIIPVINKGITLYNSLPKYSERMTALDVHHEIIEAIADHDESRARTAMIKHLQYNKKNLEDLQNRYS